ncbi:MAG: site-specific integrase [Lachnospiraceae bacterium]|nr:site-specific integrase [Lachnospiraceae bacterium]
MAVSVKRKDSKGRILKDGEQQRADGRYMFTFIDPITEKRSYAYSWKLEKTDKTPAGKKVDLSLREKEKLIEAKIREGISYSSGDITVLELVERYVDIRRNVRPTTKNGYKTVINVLKNDKFGKKHINQIKTSDAKKWLGELQKGGRSYSSIHSIRGVVRPAFRMAVEDEWLVKNPFDFPLAECLINDSIKRDALTAKQQRNFLKFIKEDEHFRQYYDGMFILFETGLRISELCGLTIKDIDLEERTININKQLQYTGGKKSYIEKTKTNAGNRVLPMSDEVYEAFKRVISSRKKQKIEKIINGYSGFLFLNDKGNPMLAYHWEKKFQYSVEKYNKIYKEELPKITPHICRHTYCSKMAKSGISVKTLQYLMGHADIQTTFNIYTHFKLEDAKNDLEKLKIREEMQKEMSVIDMAEAKQALARVKGL